MSAEDSTWLERRRRMVKCKVHGLHYDPKLTSGCAVCRKEGLLPVEKAKPQFLVLLVTLLGLAIVGFRLSGPFATALASMQLGEEQPAPVRRPPPPSEVTLDSERYRASLLRVEGAVFTPEAGPPVEMATRIADSLAALHGEIAASQPVEGAAAAADLQGLGAEIVPEGFDLAILERVRGSWRALRRKHFESVDWFQRPWIEPPAYDPAALALLDNVASELRGLVDEVAAQADQARRQVLPPTEEARRLGQWGEVQREWRGRVDTLRARMPPRPTASAPVQVQLGVQSLEGAFDLAQSLEGSAIPTVDRLEEVGAAADAARQAIEDARASG